MSIPMVCSVIFAFATVLEPMATHGSPYPCHAWLKHGLAGN